MDQPTKRSAFTLRASKAPLAAKRKGIWLVVAAQNTNGGPASPQLLQDIKSPITVPKTDP
jgi:hypothetical protein